MDAQARKFPREETCAAPEPARRVSCVLPATVGGAGRAAAGEFADVLRVARLEPRGADYFQARQWLQEFKGPPLRSGDALHLAIAKRQNLTIASADQGLVKAAEALHLPFQLIT